MEGLLTNTTFLCIFFCTVFVIVAWAKGVAKQVAVERLHRILTNPVVISFVLCGALLNGAFKIYVGSLNPGDLMQDVVAGRQLLDGQSMYPPHMGQLIDQQLAEYPPVFVLKNPPRFLAMDQRSNTATINLNAHPPFDGMLVAMFLKIWSNFRWLYLLLSLATLAALPAIILLLLKGLNIDSSIRDRMLLFGLFLGWHPVLSTLRTGQTSVIIGAAMVLGWYLFRTRKFALTGMVLAFAAALKLYPALLILYLGLRNRRAFWIGCLASVGIQAVTLAVCGRWNFYIFFRIIAFLSRPFRSRTNFSASAFLAGFVKISWIAPIILLCGLALLFYFVARNGSSSNMSLFDLEYSLSIVLLLLLTPIAWTHYLNILILPFAVVGNIVCRRQFHIRSLITFCVLLLCFSVPDTAVKQIFTSLQGSAGYYLSWVATSIFTFGLIALWIWLAVLTRNSVATLNAVD
jgi:hypothetical protein